MSDLLLEKSYSCPYCGEQIDTVIDSSLGNQLTIEDCSVCCRPIELSIYFDEINNAWNLTAKTDSD